MACQHGRASITELLVLEVGTPGIKDTVFNNEVRGTGQEEAPVASGYTRKLRNFYTDIEDEIPWVKRSNGLSRCT